MDAALALKRAVEKLRIQSYEEARPYLAASVLLRNLLLEAPTQPLSLLLRLSSIAEVPYAYFHPKVRFWSGELVEQTYCGAGFSLSGEAKDLLACYNAMIVHTLLRLRSDRLEEIEKGVQWILQYQAVRRGETCQWNEPGIQKYGGCMRSVPCYLGVVKSMLALSAAQTVFSNPQIPQKLQRGLEYILQHRVFFRLSEDTPITKDLGKLTFPFTYKSSVLEILRLLAENHCLDDPRCALAKEWVTQRQQKDGTWKGDRFYQPKDWVPFEQSAWITEILDGLPIR